jgi:hypothetical protein
MGVLIESGLLLKKIFIYLMTTEQFTELMLEIRAIRTALTQGIKPAATAAASKPAPAGSKEIPLPSESIDNPGAVLVHFGKNKGRPLADLGAKSIEWYAQEPEPRLRTDGTPFPPRAEDLLLRNAARTIVHQGRGTMPAGKLILKDDINVTEQVPF